MNLDWEKYESLTKYIYETLGKESGVIIEGHGKNCKVTGKSGVKHQIDVLTKHSDGVHEYRTAVECKYWQEKINKDIVMKVSEIIDDAGINKGVIVSKNGFTPDGISYAKFRNIGLIELREMEEKDWEGRPRIKDIKTWVERPEILNIVIDNDDQEKRANEHVQIDKMIVQDGQGIKRPFSHYIELFQNELKKQKVWTGLMKGYEVKEGKIINEQSATSVPIKGIIFKGIKVKLDIGLRFYPVDQIWLIMKSIFEERTFTISRNGVVKEDK